MKGYEPEMSFHRAAALEHDQRGDEAECVAFLEEVARGGPALELGIGTGRIALPLAERGVRVDGIDIAPAMLERLREKPGGDRLDVTLGDFAGTDMPGPYALVFVLWNSLFNLTRQEDQVRCFENVAARLADDGLFLVEAFVPAYLHRLPEGGQVAAEAVEVDEVRLGALRHDPAAQTLVQSHVVLSEDGVRMTPVAQRYAWPHELDLMAHIAGLRLRERWGGWRREPFDAESRMHVSVYGR